MTDAGTHGSGWSGFGEAEWRRLVEAAAASSTAPGPEGLAALGEAYRQFAAQFARALGAATRADAAGRGDFAATLQSLTHRFLESLAPVQPPPAAAAPAWVEAFVTWNAIIADLTRTTATAFAMRLARPDAPATLRGLFDAWIDCAESAYQVEAHSERYARVQATLFNEAIALRARQQAVLEQASRAMGVPGRREVDALHDALRELRVELAATLARADAGVVSPAAPTTAAARLRPMRASAQSATQVRRNPKPKPKLKPKAKAKPKSKSQLKPKPKPKAKSKPKAARALGSRRGAR